MTPFARKKVLIFGALGAAGCLLGWAAGEGLLAVAMPVQTAVGGNTPSLASRPAAPAPPAAPPTPERVVSTTPPRPDVPVIPKRSPPPPLPPDVLKVLEAAGGKSGQIQLTLTWKNLNDIDLHCIDPNGEEIYYGQKAAARGSGGVLDVDRRGGDDLQIENIRFLSAAPPGRYQVFVNYYSNRGSPDPTRFGVSVLVEDKRAEFSGEITSGKRKQLVHEFDLPGLRLGTPTEVILFPGGNNVLRVRLERDRKNDKPVTVKFVGNTPGLKFPAEVTIPGDRDEAEVEVEAAAGAVPGGWPVQVMAEGVYGKVEGKTKLVVQLPPAALQLAAPKTVTIQAGGDNRVPIRITRDWFDTPVRVRATAADGVTVTEVTVPAGRDEAELVFAAPADSKGGSFAVTLTASGGPATAPATATATLTAEVIALPPPPAAGAAPAAPAASWSWRLVLVIGLWTALLAIGLSLALAVGQNRYLARPWLSGRQAGVLVAGGGLAGLVAGGIGQALFALLARGGVPEVGFLAGWLLLGGLLGRGVGFFVPNLHAWRSVLAGVAGGFLGAVAFILISKLGDAAGRLVGAVLLGGCIGLMVALVEAAFRSAWLEVRYSESEVITVNLGLNPVKIGGDNSCTIWARGAPPLALRFWVRNGKVVCEDAVNQTKREVLNGSRHRAGTLEVVVRTGSGDADERVPKVERPTPASAALSLDENEDDPFPLPMPADARPVPPRPPSNDDDYDPLPLPVAPPPPPPPAAPARPASGSTKPPVPRSTVCPKCKTKVALGKRTCPVCNASW